MKYFFGLLLLGWLSAFAAEVTVMRPKAFVGQEWSYYVLVGGKPVTDLKEGERASFEVPADTRSLAIHCPKAFGGYNETRVDYDFGSAGQAFVVLEPNRDCVDAKVLDSRGAASALRQTRLRASRPLVYDAPGRPVTQQSSPSGSGAQEQIAAATAAWAEAFNSRDAARLGAMYDADAVLNDASEARPRAGLGPIGEYYKKETQRATQRVALGERSVRVFGDTAIDSGALTFFEMRDGKATTTPGRYSMTYQNRGGRWVIVDHQVSAR